MSTLKKFGYRPQYGTFENTELLFLAKSRKQVVEMAEAIGLRTTLGEVKNYFSPAWGNDAEELMEGIELTEPFVYKLESNKGTRLVNKNIKPVKLK